MFYKCHQHFLFPLTGPAIPIACPGELCVYSFLYLTTCLVCSFGKIVTQCPVQILALAASSYTAEHGEVCLSCTHCMKGCLVFPELSEDHRWEVSQHPAASHNGPSRDALFSFLYAVLSIVSPFFLNLLFPDRVGLGVVCAEWFFGEDLRIARPRTLLLFPACFKKCRVWRAFACMK